MDGSSMQEYLTFLTILVFHESYIVLLIPVLLKFHFFIYLSSSNYSGSSHLIQP